MVQEMKVGFMAAMDQLSTMQDGDQSSLHKMDATCQRQDQQLSDLSHSIDSLRVIVRLTVGSFACISLDSLTVIVRFTFVSFACIPLDSLRVMVRFTFISFACIPLIH